MPSNTLQLEWHTLIRLYLNKVKQNHFRVRKPFFQEWGKSLLTKNLITRMNKKPLYTKTEKKRHARNSVEIASMNGRISDLKKLWRHMVVTEILTKRDSRTSSGIQGFWLTKQKTRQSGLWIGWENHDWKNPVHINEKMPHVNRSHLRLCLNTILSLFKVWAEKFHAAYNCVVYSTFRLGMTKITIPICPSLWKYVNRFKKR